MIASGVRFASFGFIGAPFSGPYAFIGRSMGCAPLAVIHPGAKGRMQTHSISSATTELTSASSSTPSTLIELNGDDLRRDPLEGRKATLEMMLAKAGLSAISSSMASAGGRPTFSQLPSSSRRSTLICGHG